MSDLNEDKDNGHNWNMREEKKPVGTYLMIGLLCILLAWVLGSGISS